MEKLEKVELVREKCGVTYEEARNALEACGYDVLDAIVRLEREGKANVRTTTFTTSSEQTTTRVSPEMAQAQSEYREQTRKTSFGEAWSRFCVQAKNIMRAGLDMTFVAEHNGQRSVSIPLLFLVIGLFAWGATLWLLIIGLFFGFRYHIEGVSPVTFDVNDAMDRAANMASNIRDDFRNED